MKTKVSFLAKNNRVSAYIFLLVVVFMYLLLSISIVYGLSQPCDTELLLFIQQSIPKSWDRYLSLLSVLGSFEFTTFFLVLLSIRNRRVLAIALFVFAFVHGIEIFGKLFFIHPSVPTAFHRYDFPFTMVSSGFQTGNSYPSGHSFRSVFIILFALSRVSVQKVVQKKIITLLGLVILTIILVSRVSLGEHWPSDVIGGSLLGLGCFISVKHLIKENHLL